MRMSSNHFRTVDSIADAASFWTFAFTMRITGFEYVAREREKREQNKLWHYYTTSLQYLMQTVFVLVSSSYFDVYQMYNIPNKSQKHKTVRYTWRDVDIPPRTVRRTTSKWSMNKFSVQKSFSVDPNLKYTGRPSDEQKNCKVHNHKKKCDRGESEKNEQLEMNTTMKTRKTVEFVCRKIETRLSVQKPTK